MKLEIEYLKAQAQGGFDLIARSGKLQSLRAVECRQMALPRHATDGLWPRLHSQFKPSLIGFEEIGNEAGPPGLVRSADTATAITMEIFAKENAVP